jgi:hypothetical protein
MRSIDVVTLRRLTSKADKSILILAGSALGMSQPVLSFSGRLRT